MAFNLKLHTWYTYGDSSDKSYTYYSYVFKVPQHQSDYNAITLYKSYDYGPLTITNWVMDRRERKYREMKKLPDWEPKVFQRIIKHVFTTKVIN
jgi:hypothetical protein